MTGQDSAQEDHLSGLCTVWGACRSAVWLRDRGCCFCIKGSMSYGIIHPLSPTDLRGLASVGLWDVLGDMGVLRNIAFSDNQLTLLAAVTLWRRKGVLWGGFVPSSGADPFPAAWR